MDCIVHGVTKSQTGLSDLHFHFHVTKIHLFYSFQEFYLSLFLPDRLSVYFQIKHFKKKKKKEMTQCCKICIQHLFAC